MGEFICEGDLYANAGSSTQLLRNANLLTRNEPTENDVIHLTKRYILEQLIFLPKGTFLFDTYVVQSFQALRLMILDNLSSPSLSPSYLYTSLIEKATEEIIDDTRRWKTKLYDMLSTIHNVPPKEVLLQCSKRNILEWQPNTWSVPEQSMASQEEHRSVIGFLCTQINKYIRCSNIPRTATAIVGGPGVGKTYEMQMACVYSICQGLTTIITAGISERANALGGCHIHKLLSIRRVSLDNIYKAADDAIIRLHRNPEKLFLLRTLDVLCIDELGNLSAELLAVMNIIFQSIRGDPTYMGGVLVIASFDPKQLPPIQGTPCLISGSVLVSFNFVHLKHSVRAIGDLNLRDLIDITRQDSVTERDLRKFRMIIKSKCRHVDSWFSEDIPQEAVRILGKHTGMAIAESIYYKQVKKKGLSMVTRKAEDTQASSELHGIWRPANRYSTLVLNAEAKEPEELILHSGLVVQMTQNHPKGLYSNTQMGYIMKIPSQESLDNWESIKIMLAPPGVKNLPRCNPKKKLLIKKGWKEIEIHGCTSVNAISVKGTVKAKRRQYPIKASIAISIHSAMGSEYGSVVSSVIDDEHSEFRLWMKEQVLVLISRTKFLFNLIFVGDRERTAKILAQLLLSSSKYQDYMNYIINNLVWANDESQHTFVPVVLHSCTELKAIPINTEIPIPNVNGYVYCLLSTSDFKTTYIGSTKDLMHRLYMHRSGVGSLNTKDIHRHQWHYLCYISGFENRKTCYAFEKLWHHHNFNNMNPPAVIETGKTLMNQFSKDLRMHMCLEFQPSS